MLLFHLGYLHLVTYHLSSSWNAIQVNVSVASPMVKGSKSCADILGLNLSTGIPWKLRSKYHLSHLTWDHYYLFPSNYKYDNWQFIYRRIKPTLMLPMNWKNYSWKITLWKQKHERPTKITWVPKWGKWKNSSSIRYPCSFQAYVSLQIHILRLQEDAAEIVLPS